MPQARESNYFEFTNDLPQLYWNANTDLLCLKDAVTHVLNHGYSHHIQRLMVLSNFSNLTNTDPRQLNHWFWLAYVDAYEWVELPNVSGMILFADGGYLASKPYAAGGSYINKMSNYCKNCSYNVTKKNGPDACPFNYLYWDFLARNREKLKSNHRIAMMYKTYDRMDEAKKNAIVDDKNRLFKEMKDGKV